MGDEWPLVADGVRAHLQRVYRTPLRLDAAFDSDEECLQLVAAEFPDMVGEDLVNTVAQIGIWKESMERPFKRTRKELAHQVLFRLPFPGQASVQDEYNRLTQTSSICILEMHIKRKQKKHREDPADARARRFDAERRKYARLLSQVIIQADLPIVQLVKTLDDPEAGWLHIFAARRGNTLKNRYKVWRPFEMWLEWHRGYLFPRGVKDVIDYMQHRVDDGCGRTVPQALHTALALIESLGRVPEGSKISEDPLWLGHVKSWSAELSEDAPPRKPAEMYTTAMVLSLELTVVCETEPLFVRALSWVVLCMIWGAMRCDDVQAVLPSRTVLSNYGLRRTAVGWELMQASLLLPDGLETFFSGHSPRNYLTSVAAALGFHKDERAYLGRWSMGMVSSEEYVRTSRQVVFKIQREVNRALDENIDRLADFAAESGANKKRHTVLVPYLEKVSLGGVYPTLEVMPGDWDPDTHGETEEAIAGQIAAQSLKESMVQSGPSKFFITVSRRAGLKRLHLTGCFVRPDRCCEVIHLDVVGQDDFDAICQACRRKMLAESGKDGGELSSSTASSSSTESVASSGNEPLG
ncbi:unnamed protein product [Cladocopium goreaui]|uniref:Uncharacterized protein n=1 Tax=Cladocopium goreaui TaxID=2562237 RepID=A0A9P1DR87_9DINO|nr:unnamed protein product [Cladocopium goreaui]